MSAIFLHYPQYGGFQDIMGDVNDFLRRLDLPVLSQVANTSHFKSYTFYAIRQNSPVAITAMFSQFSLKSFHSPV